MDRIAARQQRFVFLLIGLGALMYSLGDWARGQGWDQRMVNIIISQF